MISAEIFFDGGLQPWRRHVQCDRSAGEPPPKGERCNCCDRAANCSAYQEPPYKTGVEQTIGNTLQPAPIAAPYQTPGPLAEPPLDGATPTRRMTHSNGVGAVSVLLLGPYHALCCAPRLAQNE
jgi:hypothetical protein